MSKDLPTVGEAVKSTSSYMERLTMSKTLSLREIEEWSRKVYLNSVATLTNFLVWGYITGNVEGMKKKGVETLKQNLKALGCPFELSDDDLQPIVESAEITAQKKLKIYDPRREELYRNLD